MANDPFPDRLPRNFGVARPIPQKYVPTQFRVTRDYIQMAGSDADRKHRRAEAQQIVIGQAYQTIGPDVAARLGGLVKTYPNMSPGVLMGLTRGVPKAFDGRGGLPVDKNKFLTPVYTPDPASGLARNDAEAAIADGTYNAPAPEPRAPRNLWEVITDALDSPQGIRDIPGDINNVLKAAVSGGLASAGWVTQAMTNLPRQYFGQLDNALYLKNKYDLTDEELADLYADRPDILNSLQGPKTLPDGNPVYEIFNSLNEIVFDPERRNGEKYQGDPAKRLDAARQEVQWHDASIGDMLWRNTAIGQWWNNVAAKQDPQWIPAREYAQVENRMSGKDLLDTGSGLLIPNPVKPGSFDLRTDAEREKALQDSLDYQYRRLEKGLQVSHEKVLGYNLPHEWTIGRGFMYNIDDDPHSRAQRVGAGIIDFAASFADPSAYIPVGKAARAATTLALARHSGTVSEAVVAARRAAKNPDLARVLLPDDVSDEIVAEFAGPGPVTSEALGASRLQAQADKALADAVAYRETAAPRLEFNDRGIGSLIDAEGNTIIDSGVRRTVTGQGSALTFRPRRNPSATVTLETRPVLGKDGSIESYALYRTTQKADGTTSVAKAKGTFKTADEADAAAVDKYVSDSRELADVRAARRSEDAATQRLMESAKQLRQAYRDSYALRTARLRVSGEKETGWFLHDSSETPFTNLRIARVEVDDTPLYTAGDYKVVQGKDRFAVRRGRSTEAVFDTLDEAQGYLRGKVDETLPEMVGDVPAAKLTRTDDGWASASGHVVSKTKNGRYSVYEPRDGRMVRVGTFDSYSAAQSTVRRSYASMRESAYQGMALTEQPRRRMAYGILDGDEVLSTHRQFRDATSDLLAKGRQAQTEDLARLDGAIETLKAEREGLRTGKAEVELQRTATEAEMLRLNPDDIASQFDEAYALGDEFVTDPERALIERWAKSSDQNIDDLTRAAAYAQEKKATTYFITNQKMWKVLTETKAGAKLVDWLVDATSADAIIRRMPALKADHAAALARARNADEVKVVLSNLIGPQYDLRDLSRFGMLSNARVGAVDALANSQRLGWVYRMSQFAPHGNAIDGDDVDDVYWQVRRFAEGVGAKPEEIAPYLDRLIVDARNRVERYELIYGSHGIIENVLKKGLRAKGMPEAEINKVMTAFQGGTDIAQRRRLGVSKSSELLNMPAEDQLLDSLLKGTNPVPLTGKTQEEALLAHMLLSGKVLLLPDYRNVRKAINTFAKAERWGRKNLGGTKESEPVFSKLLSDASNATISGWRNATLITGARAVRDLADLQIRFGGAGGPSVLTSPFAFVSNAVAATVARESATRWREVMKSAPLMFVPTLAKRMRRNAPGFEEERYRGSFLVDARGLERLLTDDLPTDLSGATRWQSLAKIERGEAKAGFDSEKDFIADLARHGVVEPIVIVYDRAKDGYRIADGGKRALASYRMRLPAVPVKIVSGAIEDGQSYVKAQTKKAKNWGRWNNINGNDGYYIGGVGAVIEQGRKAVRSDSVFSAGMRALIPVADREWARVNGQGFFEDFNAVLLGKASNDILSDLSNQSTTFMGNFSVDQHLATGAGRQLSTFGKESPGTFHNYAKTWADRAGELRALPHVGELLNGTKSVDDIVADIIGNPATREEYLAMTNASLLRKQKTKSSDEMLAVLRQENEGIADFVRGEYQSILEAISDLSGRGNHVDLFDAIVDGSYAGKSLSRENSELTHRLQTILTGPTDDPHYIDPYLPDRLQGIDESRMEKATSFVDRFFDAQGEVMDVFGMVGPQRDKYIEHVLDLSRYLSNADRERMARNVAGRGDKKLANRIRDVDSIDQTESLFDIDTIDKIAMRRATEDIKQVFYDAHKRRNWALALRIVSPFAQAAANTVHTWGRLMLRNPENAYRVYKPVQALLEPESDVLSDLLDFNTHEEDPYSIGRGFFAEDPASGMRTFNYPIVNAIAGRVINGLTGGADSTFELTANAQSLNSWQSGIAGGTSPLFTVPLNVLDPEASLRDGLFGQFLRLQGVSPSTADDPVQAAVEQFVPLKFMDLFTAGERKRAELIAANYAAQIASGRWDVSNAAQRTQALDAAKSKAAGQMIAEGILQLVAPTFGSMNTAIRVPTGGRIGEDGKVRIRAAAGSMLLTEARSQLYEYIKNADGTYKEGDDLQAAKNAYYEDFGIGPLLAARAMIMDKESLPRSSEAYDLYASNPQWFNDNAKVIRYLFNGEDVFGPNLEASVSRLATYYERKNGARYLTSDEMQKIIQKEYADTWAANAGRKAAEMTGGVLSSYAETAIKTEAARFGGSWPLGMSESPKQVIGQVKDALESLPEKNRALVPGYAQITTYLQERDKWDEPGDSYYLYALGRRLLVEDKSGGFSAFWFRTASDEFTETVKASSSWMD